ncbi:MAG: AraC family transcriptional regulator [Pseudomonadota bacterium]
MDATEIAAKIGTYIDNKGCDGELVATDVAGLSVLRYQQPTTFEAMLYHPVVCLILQGSKETTSGEKTVRFGPGQSLVVSHDMPVMSRVTEASPAAPYLAMILLLDISILRSLYDLLGEDTLDDDRAHALAVNDTDAALIDALGRYFALTYQPIEAKVMAPMILREIHFRLLMAPHGAMLRQLLLNDSNASRIWKAIGKIREDYRAPLTVADLAGIAGMSMSSFHDHFKSITSRTPLQYQKDLRLMEARRLLSEERHSVSAAAFAVGYESPTQFTREYTRKFGTSPRNDMLRLTSHTQ